MIDSGERVLEFILIHRLRPVPPELMKRALELSKEFIADPSKVVPGGKLIASYAAYAQSVAVCIMEAPSVAVLMPFLEQLWAVGLETEVIPAEKMEVVIPKMEKMLAQMAGS